MSMCCFNGVDGTDEYAVTLTHGWQFTKLDLQEDRAQEEGDIALESVLTQVPPCVTVDGPGAFALEAQPAYGATTVDLAIDWYVSANCSPVDYTGVISITGPVGVPYQGE